MGKCTKYNPYEKSPYFAKFLRGIFENANQIRTTAKENGKRKVIKKISFSRIIITMAGIIK